MEQENGKSVDRVNGLERMQLVKLMEQELEGGQVGGAQLLS